MLIELTPLELFRSLVMKAIKDQGLETSEMVEYYLSSLLADFVRAGKLSKEAFATRLLKATASDHKKKLRLLKELGDSSLFLSGYFQESLNTRVVDIEYYMDMGAISYYKLAGHLDSRTMSYGSAHGEDLSDLFTELSEKFAEFVEVLTQVSERTHMKTPRDILKLYEKWLKTKNPHTEALLRELGIDPVDVPTGQLH